MQTVKFNACSAGNNFCAQWYTAGHRYKTINGVVPYCEWYRFHAWHVSSASLINRTGRRIARQASERGGLEKERVKDRVSSGGEKIVEEEKHADVSRRRAV